MIGQVRPMLCEAEQTSSYYTGSKSGFDTWISRAVIPALVSLSKTTAMTVHSIRAAFSPAFIMYKSHSLVCREASILPFTIETFA